MAKTKTAVPKLRLVHGGRTKRVFKVLLVAAAVLALVVAYPAETADLVMTVVGGVGEFIRALSA